MSSRVLVVAACAALAPLLSGCASVLPSEPSVGATPDAAAFAPVRSEQDESPSAGAPAQQAAPQPAPAAAKSPDDWRYALAPYVWLFDIDGTIANGARSVPVSSHLHDAVDLVQEHFEFAFAAHFEARKGDWAFFFDGDYLSFSEDGSASREILGGLGVASADLDVDLKIALAELGVARRIAEIPAGGHTAVVEVLGGVRWNGMRLDADLEAAGSTARRDFERVYDVDFDTDWADPLIGLRTFVPLSGNTILLLRGDIGGGVGSGADRAWNVVTGLVFRVGESTELFAGYRWYDFERDIGGRDSDLQLEGPGIGLEMRF